MKRILTYLAIVLVVSIAGYVNSQDITRPPIDDLGRSDLFDVGKAFPFFYVGTTTIASASAGTTAWMQISYSFEDTTTNAEKKAYRKMGWQDAKYFGLDMTLSDSSSATQDSAGVDTAYFECAWDTNAAPIWNADLSNFFITTGAYDSTLYGISVYNPLSLDSTTASAMGYNYKLAVQRGGYVRLIFSTPSDIADPSIVNWTLWCKN